MNFVGYAIGGALVTYILTAGEKERAKLISALAQEESFKEKISLSSEQNNFDIEQFNKNSVPVSGLGEDIYLDNDRLVYRNNEDYTVINLSQPSFIPMSREETNNSKILALALSIIVSIYKSTFLSEQNKKKLHNLMDVYLQSLYNGDDTINFFTSGIRTLGHNINREKFGDYTREELEKAYDDYKITKLKKTYSWRDKMKYVFGSRHQDRDRYIEIAENWDNLKQQLVLSMNEIEENFNIFKKKCIQKLDSVNVFKEKKKSKFLTRVIKNKAMIQRLFFAYKQNGENFDTALFKLACELYSQRDLLQGMELNKKDEIINTRIIENRHVNYLTQNEIEEQVRRYFNFKPNSTRFLDNNNRDISIDSSSKIIAVKDPYYGVYYLDFSQLKNDINNPGGKIYYNRLLERLKGKSDVNAFMLNKKNAKIMRYIEDTVQKMENKTLKDDEYEYTSNMLFHWISSLMNQYISEEDKQKKIVTVTLMGGCDDDENHDCSNIHNWQNISFDVYDQENGKMKMGTIVKKGEKIYYKEDPGLEEFKIVSAEELLQRLDVMKLQVKDIEKQYIGDTWNMRLMIDFVRKLAEQEKQKDANTSPKTETKVSVDCQNTFSAKSISDSTSNNIQTIAKDISRGEKPSNNDNNVYFDERAGNKNANIIFQQPVDSLSSSHLEASIGK